MIESVICVLDDDAETLLGVLGFLETTAASFLLALANCVTVFGDSAESASRVLDLLDLRTTVLVKEEL